MFYIADLHVHAHYAGATSKYANLETLYQWAQVKGIDLIGTGDFTHPAWINELQEKLQPAGNGFYLLKNAPLAPALPGIKVQHKNIHFCLSAEVCCVYTLNGKEYSNHHLLYAPDFKTALQINKRLSQFADLSVDGRPTLPITAQQLFAIILEIGKGAHFVPAHIWTPWFSTLGSKNGHSSLHDCFGDLTKELFAVETSLSADPLMCRQYSALEGLALMSNSDAHTAHKLGREANLFDTEFSYTAMFNAVKNKTGFLGTYEFYPPHGKYFNDGHRKCGISLSAYNAEHQKNICNVCGKPLTLGVAHRVQQLADKSLTVAALTTPAFKYVVPLPEMFAEILGYGEESNKVKHAYTKAISTFGNEFNLLLNAPLQDVERHNRLLAIAVNSLRQSKINSIPGYDGIYGSVHFFEKEALQIKKSKQLNLFG
jgi:DNA helicase II / ATP-dependent DNA helicase PcrA